MFGEWIPIHMQKAFLFYSHFFYLITPASQKYKCEAIDSVLEWKITYRSIKQSKTSMCNLILSFDPKCVLVFCTEHSNSSKQTFITQCNNSNSLLTSNVILKVNVKVSTNNL